MDQIKYQQPTAEEFRAIRYSIHRDVHGRSVALSNKRADADLAKWQAEQNVARAADAYPATDLVEVRDLGAEAEELVRRIGGAA